MSKFTFSSGLTDCCTSNPEYYTVLAEIGDARLVEMKVPPGGEDKPHDHPAHAMFFVKPAKLSITPYGTDGKPAGEAHEVEIPAGAAPIFPAGAHQVKNVGDSDSCVVFVEPYPSFLCQPCESEALKGWKSPFKVAPQCYKVLAEDDTWYTGLLEMEPGAEDGIHNHKDHLFYVLEGDEVTIYPGGDKSDPQAVPIKAGAGVPAPEAAGPIFSKHIVKNSGKTKCKIVFFEKKEPK